MVVITDLNFPSDDFQALSLLLGMAEARVVHVVATDGNTWAEEVAENIAAVLRDHGHTDVPVTVIPAPFRHERRGRALRAYRAGAKRFLGPYLKSLRPRSEGARGGGLAEVAATLAASASEVVVLSLGPLYPLVALMDASPGLLGKVRQVLAMAGHFSADGAPRRVDFNVWFDPAWAKRLFDSGVEVTLVPRNACEGCVLDAETLEALRTLAAGAPRACRFFADLVGMLAQHGRELPLIDTLLPLLMVEPELVAKARRGVVHVRRKPLAESGRTYFRERGDGNVVVVDALDPARVRQRLVRCVRALGACRPPAQPDAGNGDYRIHTWIRQRLFDRPFHRISIGASPAGGRGAPRRLDAGELGALYREIWDMVVAQQAPRFDAIGGYHALAGTRGADEALSSELRRLARGAALLAQLVQADAAVTCSDGETTVGFAILSVVPAWRRIEIGRRFGRPVAEGDAVVELACARAGPGGDRILESMHAALVAWWRQEREARGARAGTLLYAPAASGMTSTPGPPRPGDERARDG